MKRQKLVVIGNGMAGMRTVEELIDVVPDMYDITVFGDEPYGNYNRILLSNVLSGEQSLNDIMLNSEEWYQENNITLHKGCKVTHIDRKKRIVTGSNGEQEEYDRLLMATGSSPFILPLPGKGLKGVITFRDIADVEAMMDASETYTHAVVIGGGLLGLEAANGLMKRGMKVSVIHLMDTLMERQMDPHSGDMLKKSLIERGLDFHMEATTEAILGDTRVQSVKLKDGTILPADIVVMAVGIKPNIKLAENSGIHCERGIVVRDTMQTFDPRTYAVGECVQHRKNTYGLVAPLFEQAKVCANHLAESSFAQYKGSVTSTKLKVTGIDLFSAGNFIGDESTEDIILNDVGAGVYKRVVLKDNKIEGAVMYGDTMDGAWYFQMMRDGTDVSAFRDNLLFGQSHMGDSGTGGNMAADMPDTAEVCGCNGICKGTITKAIVQKKLFTLDDVKTHTKAASSCGSCTGLVEQIISSTLGGDYSEAPSVKAMCKCTKYGHSDVRKVILKEELKNIPAVMKLLDWKTPNGCASCRPALNYYMLCAWPGEYIDDQQSRYINERAHANIQKDGTYSVVPRMWGGLTTPDELRAIADVADKFEVPTVKVTGGQRIDLFGVQKKDLPAVWDDLNKAGMVSGHAYGKSLRTVKTCVGSDWCRFGTQDSTGMGVKLEKMAWGTWTPHKFKMAVSGCPRNCAEATIKDFGVVAVDSGWELHVGGNGGIKVRGTDFLCKVETESEVFEYCGAFLQYYREDAHYLERTMPWIERVGLATIKDKILESAKDRRELYERFLLSQKFSQSDPWADRAEDDEFQHLPPVSDNTVLEPAE